MILLVLLACASDPTPAPPSVDTADMEHADTGMDTTLFESAESCASCHPRQYAEWRQSMHSYAALSPVFDAMTAKAYRDTSGEVGTFCTRCHTPIGVAQGEDGTSNADTRSPLSREGITCDVCHTTVGHSGAIGNTELDLRPGGPKQGPFHDPQASMHSAEASDFVTSPELCGSCHDVFMFPGLRIEEAYTEYIDSPAAAEGVRCQDCHMSPVPGVVAEREWGPAAEEPGASYPDRELSSHRFVGPDYALLDDFPYPDDLEASAAAQAEYLEQVQVLLDNAVRLARVETELAPNGQVLVQVDVENLVSGHRVPTGFTSERQLWLDLTVTDDAGQVVFTTGDLDAYGDLRDAHSWAVELGEVALDDQLVNYQSKNKLRAWEFDDNGHNSAGDGSTSEAVFPFEADWIEKHSLEPLEVRTEEFLFAADPAAELTVRVAVRYRNLPPYLLRALGLDDLVERLQVFTLDTAEVRLGAG